MSSISSLSLETCTSIWFSPTLLYAFNSRIYIPVRLYFDSSHTIFLLRFLVFLFRFCFFPLVFFYFSLVLHRYFRSFTDPSLFYSTRFIFTTCNYPFTFTRCSLSPTRFLKHPSPFYFLHLFICSRNVPSLYTFCVSSSFVLSFRIIRVSSGTVFPICLPPFSTFHLLRVYVFVLRGHSVSIYHVVSSFVNFFPSFLHSFSPPSFFLTNSVSFMQRHGSLECRLFCFHCTIHLMILLQSLFVPYFTFRVHTVP